MRLGRRGVQAEQVRRCPSQRLGLLAPFGEKALPVLDALSPAGDVDQGRRAGLEDV